MTNATSTTTDRSDLAGRKEWTAFVVLLLPLLLVSMDVSVLFFAIPSIDRDLAPSATQQLWIFDVYGFALSGLLITMGSLGDRIGRRKLLLLGAAAFGTASVGAAYATSPEMLIAARALLGIGGATLMPSTMGLVRNMFRNERQRSTAVGIWSGAMAGGIALGSVLSGVMLQHFWWGSVFLINVPAMVLLLVLVPMLVPEFKDPNPGRFDLWSVPLSMGAVLPVVYGVKESAAHGLDARNALIIAIGLLVSWFFVRRQRVRDDAMISRELFRGKGFAAGIGLNSLAAFAMMGSAFFTTQYLQSVLGMSTMEAALWSLAPSLAVGAAAPTATAIAQRVDRSYVISAGFVIAAAGFALLALSDTDSLWLLLIGSAVMSSGIVTVMALVSDLALATAPPEKAGSAASLLETGQEFGGAMGMALLGAVATAVYAADLPDSAPEAARKTLPGALATGDASLISAGREAFVHSMQYASVAGSLILLAGAVLAVALLRRGSGAVKQLAPTH
ncbi:MFS transporter [Streptomyces sp. NBC_01707]|uniref:MFS transporter n=1 Tax=unclassified Streptomyces TaxID=2593676 RepID=UPI0008E24855|nr:MULTISPECIES: MFS transporter [unclassified Streptomyces]MDX3769323.1 MFS transporter [Streptomyces sp. AK08-01B]MDX3818387.1 MFS transporter [Streptomyces sp. AK08-01A]SFT19228.1 MFS transporter, DHA2 family, multidrug resistance protein [Streptomyces sp. ok210]